MRAHLPQAESHGLLLSALAEGRLVGVLSSTPPGAYPLPPASIAVRLRCALGQGLRVAHRWARVYELLREHHPVDRHWYLGTLGVEPALWGRGIGTDLLSAWLPASHTNATAARRQTLGQIPFWRARGRL